MEQNSPKRISDAKVTLTNHNLAVAITSAGAVRFSDKQHKIAWGSDTPGWVTLDANGKCESVSLRTSSLTITQTKNTVDVCFSGIYGELVNDPNFALHIRIELQETYFEVEILEVITTYTLVNIEYPAHLLGVLTGKDHGYVVVPNLQGTLIPNRYDAGFMRYGHNIWDVITDIEQVWSFESGNLNMPWFGAVQGDSSILAYVKTAADAQLRVIGNAVVAAHGRTAITRRGEIPGTRMSSLSPIWLASRQSLAYPRKLRVELVVNGYVGMAKRYLDYAKVSGRYVTMAEKIKTNPEYEKIIGAPDIKVYVHTNRPDNPLQKAWSEPVLMGYSRIHTTFDQVAMIADDLYALGIERCMLIVGGWNRMGYDREHPDMWPPVEAAGGAEGLRRACERVRGHGFLFALHDNYNDFYPDAPSYSEDYIIKEVDGSLRLGGVWDGGPCQVICSARQKELLDRNLRLILDVVPLNGYYFDVVTSVSPYECYDPQHPNTRQQDLEHRHTLFFDIRDRGLVVGGERGADWAMPAAAFYEGMQGGGKGYHRGVTYHVGLNVPLFYLVYHECVVGYWQHGTPYGREDHANHVLHDLLCGQPSSWSLVYEQWDDLKGMIKETYDLLGTLHRRTAHHPLQEHQILTEDYLVQQSTFGDGTQVWGNYGITTWHGPEVTLPPKGFALQYPGEAVKVGTVERHIRYLS